MVNGVTSRIIYIGAWASIMLCIIGYIVLAALDNDAPVELQMAMTASFGVIAGSHIMPPIGRKASNVILERRGE